MKPITKDIIQNLYKNKLRKYRRRHNGKGWGLKLGIGSGLSIGNRYNLNSVEKKYIVANIKPLDNQCLNFSQSVLHQFFSKRHG